MFNTTTAARTALTAALLTLAACSTHHSNTARNTGPSNSASPTSERTSITAPQTSPLSSVPAPTNPVLPPKAPTASNPAPSVPVSISTNPPANPVQTYLTIAHTAYPATSDTTLINQGHHVCTQLAHGTSLNDLTGDLAAHLGNQALAHRLITAAITAYCPSDH